MPKVTKKKQVNHHLTNLDTGYFSYQILKESTVAHIISMGAEAMALKKVKGLDLFGPLVNQAELILRKEQVTDIFYNGSFGPETLAHFTKNGWTTLRIKPLMYMEPLAEYLLYKDISKTPIPKQSMAQLLGDDHKQKIANIIEGTSLPKAETIDTELEPAGAGGRFDEIFLINQDEQRRVMNLIAPAEPLANPPPDLRRGVRPRPAVQFVNRDEPFPIPQPEFNNRGPENPQQVPRGNIERWLVDEMVEAPRAPAPAAPIRWNEARQMWE